MLNIARMPYTLPEVTTGNRVAYGHIILRLSKTRPLTLGQGRYLTIEIKKIDDPICLHKECKL